MGCLQVLESGRLSLAPGAELAPVELAFECPVSIVSDRRVVPQFVGAPAGGGEGDPTDLVAGQFVEVGAPVCQKEGQTDCNANELKGFQYRLDSGSGWGTRPVKGKPEMIVMPLQQTPLFKAVAAGNPDFLAVKDYARRMAEIKTQAAMLMNQQKDVLADLKKASERPKLLAF